MLELAGILVLGIFAQWMAWKIKLPAILPLILIGLTIGPLSTFITPDGEKLLDGDLIFNQDFLFPFVSISVAVILFEGGLTLKLKEIKTLASTVRNILTIGVVITLLGGTFAALFLLGLNFRIAFLFGALIIVSGPTVIMPILRNVKPNLKINTVLKWEGILIDPLGALIAVLAYEFVRSSRPQEEYTLVALKGFFLTISTGVFIGIICAFLLYYLLRKNRLPAYLRNVVTLAIVIMGFAFSEFLMRESGLMTATIMGIILANLRIPEIKHILSFKEDINLILISVLFIILSSRINIEQINRLGIQSLILFAVIIFVIRPLAIFMSTLRSNLNLREKLFISWIGPKGIVAAAVASLFSLELIRAESGVSASESADANMILPLVFMMIIGTVIIQGGSAKYVAKWLGVERQDPQGVLFVGASEPARYIAKYLQEHGVTVLLVDTSHANILDSKNMGLNVHEGSVLKDNILEELDTSFTGRLMSLTSSSEINMLACKLFQEEFGEENIYRLITRRESELKELDKPKNLLFDGNIDYYTLLQTIRRKPPIKEKQFSSPSEFEEFMEKNKKKMIPLFIKTPEGLYKILSGFETDFSKGDYLVYIDDRLTSQIEMEPVA
ncbi:MAG: cation:proton antiporter [Candidatus Cyclobacteriaceae bacterium M3_2C_046]